MVGIGTTVTLAMAGEKDTQPLLFVPDTEYVVLTAGLYAPAVLAIVTPFTEYVLLDPVGFKLKFKPIQTDPLKAVMVGDGTTNTVEIGATEGIETHPAALVPLTVKLMFALGLITGFTVPEGPVIV